MAQVERRARRIFRKKDLPQVVGYGRTKIKEMIENQEFPDGFNLSEGANPRKGWDEADIVIWQDWRHARHLGQTKLSWAQWFKQHEGK